MPSSLGCDSQCKELETGLLERRHVAIIRVPIPRPINPAQHSISSQRLKPVPKELNLLLTRRLDLLKRISQPLHSRFRTSNGPLNQSLPIRISILDEVDPVLVRSRADGAKGAGIEGGVPSRNGL